ncbi:IclR family transcriptional regulator [Aeromicrobium ponti]|uniref:IclR family transcriptional regulator n=1 Tax=Cytobacillus oceanisediminis TaxID=665099 RepID=A0A562K6A0_9BACI|nr:IclR family transcriptional regulator [Cytobacillus oceanisediminis]TWH90937.1 IclR family transcriptional regulator [Cytobacillus oceanisediminis]
MSELEKKNSNFIPSVYSALNILEFLTKEKHKQSTLTELSSALGISKSTCLRILKTLELKDYVHFDPISKRYKLGSYLISLGLRSKEMNDFMNTSISYLPTICEEVKQTVVLAKRNDNLHLAYIAKEEPDQQIRLTISPGETFPIIGGAVGKSYLAHLPDSEISKIIAEFMVDGHLPRFTENTITNPEKFIEELKTIRQEGIAETNSEHTQGIHAISCPIFNGRSEVVLSVGILLHSTFSNSLSDLTYYKGALRKHAHHLEALITRYF